MLLPLLGRLRHSLILWPLLVDLLLLFRPNLSSCSRSSFYPRSPSIFSLRLSPYPLLYTSPIVLLLFTFPVGHPPLRRTVHMATNAASPLLQNLKFYCSTTCPLSKMLCRMTRAPASGTVASRRRCWHYRTSIPGVSMYSNGFGAWTAQLRRISWAGTCLSLPSGFYLLWLAAFASQ